VSIKGKIVFSSGRSADFDIWTLDLESGLLQQLTHGSELNDMPRWSPDGSKVVFISSGEDLVPSLNVMDSDGSNRQRLTSGHYCQNPSWSPDGKSILYTGNIENPEEIEICLHKIETGTSMTLFSRKGIEAEPEFSPDGNTIIFAGINNSSDTPYAHRDTEIYEYDVKTGKERVLCSHPARDYSPVYSPDGSQIAFVSHRNGRCEEELAESLKTLYANLERGDRQSIDQTIAKIQALDLDSDIHVMDADGSNLRQITTNGGADVGARWSPCGNYLVYSSTKAGKAGQERLSIVEVESGNYVPLDYDRTKLMQEIKADPSDFLNKSLMMHLVPDFIERPFMKFYLGSHFWGRERWPDWSR